MIGMMPPIGLLLEYTGLNHHFYGVQGIAQALAFILFSLRTLL